MAALYDFNHQPERWNLNVEGMSSTRPAASQDRPDIHQWGGPLHRRAVRAIYTIAFLCMLRIDEALKIQFHHIEIRAKKITLTLPFRKTHQFGGESFFYFLSFTYYWHLLFQTSNLSYYTCFQRRRHIYAPFEPSLTGSLPLVSPLDMSLGEWLLVTGLLPTICQWYVHSQIQLNITHIYNRPQNNCSKCSAITCWISASTPLHMAPTRSVVGVVSTFPQSDDGSSDVFVTGVGGARSFRAWPSSSTWSHGMTSLRRVEIIFWIRNRPPVYSALIVVGLVHVHRLVLRVLSTLSTIHSIALVVY